MENRYTIDQISTACKVSKQSLYKFINKNKTFIEENSTRIHRVVYYNQIAMDFFLAYYQPDKKPEITPDTINQTTAEIRAPEGEQKSPVEAPQSDEPPEVQLTALQRKIDALKAEIDALKKELNAKEEERKELIRQNGALILTLQQEKQEKQLFLPSPKKTLSEKLKSIFTHKS